MPEETNDTVASEEQPVEVSVSPESDEFAFAAPSLEGQFAGTEDDFFSTSLPKMPPAIPDAHRGTIEGVTLKRFDNDKGTVAIIVALRSLDMAGFDTEYAMFIPKLFAEDIKVDADTLPSEKGNNQQWAFRKYIANADGTADLQQLRKFAQGAGRTAQSVGIAGKASDIDEFVENHNKLLTGLEIVFYRRPEDGEDQDPTYKNRLKVKGILSIDTISNPKRLKAYDPRTKKGVRRMWDPENQ